MSGRPSVTFRAAEPGDSEFLLRLYASTRAEELAVTGWSDEQKSFFVNQQFTAQTQHYALHYSAADCRIILVDGQPAGRLIILRTEKELRLVARFFYALTVSGLFFLSRLACRFSMRVFCGFFFVSLLVSCDLDM